MRLTRLGFFGVFFCTLLLAGLAPATITAPSLVVRSAVARFDPDGAILRVEGAFPFAELIQRDYPLQLFVREAGKGTRFVFFSVKWGTRVGDDPIVNKGLDSELAHHVLHLATLTDEARFLSIQPGVIEVQLPPDFPTGIAEAQLNVFYEGLVIFSNPMPFLIDEAEE